jgi:carbamoyl-phosphate synthase large subunit
MLVLEKQKTLNRGGCKVNILLSSAARRVDFVKYFREGFIKAGVEGRIITADPDYNAPALQHGDQGYITPHQTHPAYIDSLVEICRDNEIEGFIPLNDMEIALVAAQKRRFEEIGVSVFAPDPATVEKMRDKGSYETVFKGFQAKAPKTYFSCEEAERAVMKGEASFPMILKPRNGSASVGIEIASCLKELYPAYRSSVEQLKRAPIHKLAVNEPERNVIIQEYIHGEKFSMDIFNDLEGNFIVSFVRKQLAMRAGDVDRCRIVTDPALHNICRDIGRNLGHAGYVNADAYFDGTHYYVIDINPRFAGGYSFSHEAGADIPAVIIAILSGREIQQDWLNQKEGMEFARHDAVAVIHSQKCRDMVPVEH